MWSAGRPFGINVFVPNRAFKHDFLWILTLDLDKNLPPARYLCDLGSGNAACSGKQCVQRTRVGKILVDESFWDDFLGNDDFR